jgi:hypothetical protein
MIFVERNVSFFVNVQPAESEVFFSCDRKIQKRFGQNQQEVSVPANSLTSLGTSKARGRGFSSTARDSGV